MARDNRSVFTRLRLRFDKARSRVFGASNLNKIARDTIKIIFVRTKTGKGVTKSGNRYNLPGLTSNYKEQRRRYKRNLDSTTSPGKSNLTATGQLLKSMFTRSKFGQIIIGIKDSRSKTLSGGLNRTTNSEVLKHQEDQDRRFFDLTKTEKREIQRRVAKQIKDSFRRR